MNPDQLRETTMDPATRRVPVANWGALQDTLKMFTLLMGKGEASGRRRGWAMPWRQRRGGCGVPQGRPLATPPPGTAQ